MNDTIIDQVQAQKSNYRRSHYARLTTKQWVEYIHVMDNKKK